MQATQLSTVCTADNRFLRLPQVMALIGLSKSTVYKLVRRGEFPAPLRLSERCIAWRAAEVASWMDARRNEA